MPAKRKAPSYSKDDLLNAYLEVDKGASQKKAAQKWGVPRTVLSDRLHGRLSKADTIHPKQRLLPAEEDQIVIWILRQESLGFAPSHSNVRAIAWDLIKRRNEDPHQQPPPLGKNWIDGFKRRNPSIHTKIGQRQEAARFNAFTPKAVNWYFDIREGHYGWILPENTYNVDEGGIMAGFGIDSLVLGLSERRSTKIKSSQGRLWTTLIETVRANGTILTPGIIFKGTEMQQQWFLDEFKAIADWHLEDVYLPQTTPKDPSDARLIILDRHGSHRSDEFMVSCYRNNVFLCFLPAHTSHGLQPLDNGVFNILKAAYRRELAKFAFLTDAAPVDKINFLRCYINAKKAVKEHHIRSAWAHTGNHPISRTKALTHPEIQPDREGTPDQAATEIGLDRTPTSSRQINDLSKDRSPTTRLLLRKVAKAFETQAVKMVVMEQEIKQLQAKVDRLRPKRRRKVPNPNRRFIEIGEILSGGPQVTANAPSSAQEEVVVDEEDEEDDGQDQYIPSTRVSRSGREVIIPRRLWS
ncbi:transposase [Seiridium cupressi]